MAYVVDDAQTRNFLAVQQDDGLTLLLAEDCNQNIRDPDFPLPTRLDIEHCTLQRALETDCRLHFTFLGFGEPRRRLIEILLQPQLELGEIATTGVQDLGHLWGIKDRQQQVLDRDVLMVSFACVLKRTVQTMFKLVGQH